MPDTANDAQQLADLFTKLAGEIDAFRNVHYDDLSPQQRLSLEAQIQQLYDCQDRFSGESLQKTIDALQGDLTSLTNVAKQAAQALQHLQTVKRVLDIASAASNIAQAILTGGYGQIPEATRAFAQSVAESDDKSVSN